MSTKKKNEHSPVQTSKPTVDAPVNRGESAFARLAPRLRAIPDKDLAAVNLDIGAAALVALGVAGHVATPAIRVRFTNIAGPEFDIASVDDLEDAAWSAYYAATEADKFRALPGETRTLPADLVERATAIETRMQKCCEYYYDDDPVVGPELARLRPGIGYRDLANDLNGYADIYVARQAVLEKDTRFYRPTDVADARAAAEEILVQLGLATSPEARVALDNLARAWTFLRDIYGEVRSAGLFLERADATAPERYPSLIAATRAAPSAKPTTPPAPPAPPATGIPPAAPTKPTT